MSISTKKHFARQLIRVCEYTSMTKDSKWEEQHERCMIIKSMHGIEKGLSLKNVKMGFGIKKLNTLLDRIERYYEKGYDCNDVSIRMALATINEYVEYFDERGGADAGIKARLEEVKGKIKFEANEGGIYHVTREQVLDFDREEFKKVLYSRHSLRHFDDSEVDIELVKKSIEEANRCPSACNRQPTRVHIVTKREDLAYIAQSFEGIGGFAEDCKMMLLIAGTVTAFDEIEMNQWIVNAGIVTGVLSLTLHANGIGSCVIQRPLVKSKKIISFRERFNIPDNQEIVCAMALGNYPEEFVVPKSTRLPIDTLVIEH